MWYDKFLWEMTEWVSEDEVKELIEENPSLTEYDNWNSWATATINWINWLNQKITLTANCTLTLSNPVEWETYLLRIFQDWTGGRTPTFSPTIKPARTITTTASEYAIIGLYYVWWVYHSALLNNL